MLEQSKSGFKRTSNWNKDEPKLILEQQNRYLDFLLNPSFQRVSRFFLSFQNTGGRTLYTKYYLPLVKIKNNNVVIDGRNFSD